MNKPMRAFNRIFQLGGTAFFMRHTAPTRSSILQTARRYRKTENAGPMLVGVFVASSLHKGSWEIMKQHSTLRPPGLKGLALIAAIGFGVLPATASAAVNILNPSGGTDLDSGLRIHTENARYQIVRGGLKQIYQENGSFTPGNFLPGTLTFALYADGAKFVGNYPDPVITSPGGDQWTLFSGPSPIVEWIPVSNTLTDLTGGVWRNVEILIALRNFAAYEMTITTDYAAPNNFAEVTVSVSVPQEISGPVALYLVSDFFLNENDNGPTATALVGDRRYVVQTAGGAVGGILESDGAANDVTSYLAGAYIGGYGGGNGGCYGPCNGTAYPNTVDPSGADAGVHAHWALEQQDEGDAGRRYTRKVKLYFSNEVPGPNLSATMTSITNVSPSPVLTGLQYTVSGNVSLENSDGAPGTLPGKVEVAVDESLFCTDDSLTEIEAGIYAFSCSGTAGEPGEYLVEATYTDTGVPQVYDTSSDTTDQVVNAPPPVSCDGFFAPVDRRPTVNRANAGRVIPLKWRCTLDGAPVTLVPEDFRVSSTACSSGATTGTLDAIEEYAAGNSGLINQGNGYWQFNWATPKSFANSCRTTTVTFEGTTISADFRFVR